MKHEYATGSDYGRKGVRTRWEFHGRLTPAELRILGTEIARGRVNAARHRVDACRLELERAQRKLEEELTKARQLGIAIESDAERRVIELEDQ